MSGMGSGAAEATGLVQHGQERDADAGALRGAQQRQAHVHVSGVGRASHVVMDIVEFADAGVPRFQHFHIQAECDLLQLLGVELAREVVHELSPAPETVVRGGAVFGETRHAPLEGMRVEVGHPWNDGTWGQGCTWRLLRASLNALQRARGIPLKQDVPRPSARKQRVLGKQRAHGVPSAILPWRTTHRMGFWPNQYASSAASARFHRTKLACWPT